MWMRGKVQLNPSQHPLGGWYPESEMLIHDPAVHPTESWTSGCADRRLLWQGEKGGAQ
jgi:hypothetical protein